MVGTPVVASARLFNAYHSTVIAAVFTALAMRPSTQEIAVIAALCLLSTCVCALTFWREWSVASLEVFSIPPNIAPVMVRAAQGMASILVVLSTTALWKALMLRALAQIITSREAALKLHKLLGSTDALNNNATTFLTERQRVLLGIPPACKQIQLSGAPPCGASRSSILLVPMHHAGFEKESSINGACWSRRGNAGIGAGSTAAVNSPRGPFSVQVSSYPMEPHGSTSPALPQDHHRFPSPWSSLRSRREVIKDEESFIEFLADVDKNILGKGASQTATPFLQANSSCGVRTMGMNPSSLSHSGSGNTPRVFPFSNGIVPPKLKESELPGPMSLEQFYGGLRQLGILDSIEYWRDSLRQWFSSILLKPLVHKLDTSHWQVMAGAAKLGIAINVGHIGGEHFVPAAAATTDEWVTPFGPDEDALMHQLRACLLQTRDMRPPPSTSLFGLQNVMQEKVANPAIQECLDAITEHQRLRALMKGDWGKGLLPLTTMRADYSVHRVRELANGSCAKQFDWSGTESHHHENSCNPELPSDPHLMLYLFCALLEHPQWVLHDHPDAQWGVNPLFVAATPHKERIPDTYVAVLPHAPGYLHAGACVLCIGKQRPPVFALYWDLKLQFSFQGRSALWDAILLLCHRIRVAHGGVVRGVRLDSPALILSSVMGMLYPTAYTAMK